MEPSAAPSAADSPQPATGAAESSVAADPVAGAAWERTALSALLHETLAEQRRARRWKTFTSIAWLFFFVFVFLWLVGATAPRRDTVSTGKHTALVELRGVISSDARASSDKIITSLQAAFADRNTQAVVLRINSPGGSPVHAGNIHDEIKRLRQKHAEIPLYVVVQDVAASGGYYVAAAADRIYVDKASIVGSIGVVMDGFGFTGAMEKLGVERRLVTAGSNKAFLDPFSPTNAEQSKYAQQMLNEVHEQFIKVVREGRGKRLQETPEMFSGLVWSGETSIRLGLADGIGSLDQVARDVVKAETIMDFTAEDSFSEQLARRLSSGAAVSFATALVQQVEARLQEQRAQMR